MTCVQVPPFATSTELWARVASHTVGWARDFGLSLVDAVLLVPSAHHIGCARRAFADCGADVPLIETVRTLAASISPPAAGALGALALDVAVDRFVAQRALPGRFRSNRASAMTAATSVVATAHAFATALAAVPPGDRAAHVSRWRQRLVFASGSHGEHEQTLARIALDWAADAPEPVTDALFRLRPAGWVVVQGELPGVPTSIASALIGAAEAADVPTLGFDAALDEETRASLARRGTWTVSVCRDFEEEAQRSAAAVIDHLNAGRSPVALVSQDRLIVRRVHALLSRQGVPTRDETGWTLSTTRAASALRSLLQCARHGASCDDWLDWLKSCPDIPASDSADIERRLRRHRVRLAARVDASAFPDTSARLWRLARQVVDPLLAPPRRSFAQWHGAFSDALGAFGLGRWLAVDAAGDQLLRTLRLDPPRPPATIDPAVQIDLAGYADWIDTAMEHSTFLPPVGDDAASAAVVITPLGRAAWRPFAAIVVPGADGMSLGPASAAQTLFGEAETVQLGLPGRAAAQARQHDALAQLLREPHVDFLRREVHDGAVWPQSPPLQWLQFMRQSPTPVADDPRVERQVPFAPVPRPQPSAANLLPNSLSATACGMLRACPYRFHAMQLLHLAQADELDAEADGRDYGNWVHDVLRSFHEERAAITAPIDDAALLHACAERAVPSVEPDDFVPYRASFARFAPRYLDWLGAHEATGARWLAGEVPLVGHPAEWEGMAMHGTLDRIDSLAAGADGRQVIDYKTSKKDRLKPGLTEAEDVQLPFYAALMSLQPDVHGELRASYLLLDESEGVETLPCPDAAVRGATLVDGIARDLRRLRAGAPMPALGEGESCTHCAARGLCRRDHWSPPETAPAPSSEAPPS